MAICYIGVYLFGWPMADEQFLLSRDGKNVVPTWSHKRRDSAGAWGQRNRLRQSEGHPGCNWMDASFLMRILLETFCLSENKKEGESPLKGLVRKIVTHEIWGFTVHFPSSQSIDPQLFGSSLSLSWIALFHTAFTRRWLVKHIVS